MASRLTGLKNGYGLGRPISIVRSWSVWKQAAVGAVLLLAVLAACSSTNTYPIDLYTAMHYQKSYKSLEPPRFQSPAGAVPVEGRTPLYSAEQITQLENPIASDEASLAIGQQLYAVNCAMCHGDAGNGDGPMAERFVANGANPPAVLTDARMDQFPDSHIYNVVTNGLGQWMPAFGELIPGDDIWHLVNYVRSLREQG